MDRKPTMLEQLQNQKVAEKVIFLQRWNYEMYFDSNTQVFTIALILPNSGERYHLPIGRLEFAQFVRDLQKSLEAAKAGENGSSISPSL